MSTNDTHNSAAANTHDQYPGVAVHNWPPCPESVRKKLCALKEEAQSKKRLVHGRDVFAGHGPKRRKKNDDGRKKCARELNNSPRS